MFGVEFDSDPSASETKAEFSQINNYTTLKVFTHENANEKFSLDTRNRTYGATNEFQAIFQTIDENKQQMILCHHYDH
jgi:hypothetical protein